MGKILLVLCIWIGIDILIVYKLYRNKVKRIDFDDGYIVIKKEDELP